MSLLQKCKYTVLTRLSFLQQKVNGKKNSDELRSIENFRFWDGDDYEYEIFPVLSSALSWTRVISAGKRDSRRHSTTSFSKNIVVAGTSYQILKFIILEPGTEG